MDTSAVCDPEWLNGPFPSCRLHPKTVLDIVDKLSGDRLGSPFLTAAAVSATGSGNEDRAPPAQGDNFPFRLKQKSALLESKSPPTSLAFPHGGGGPCSGGKFLRALAVKRESVIRSYRDTMV